MCSHICGSQTSVFVQHTAFGDSCVIKFVYLYVGMFYIHVPVLCLFFVDIKLHLYITCINVIRVTGLLLQYLYILYKFRYNDRLLWYFTASRITITVHNSAYHFMAVYTASSMYSCISGLPCISDQCKFLGFVVVNKLAARSHCVLM